MNFSIPDWVPIVVIAVLVIAVAWWKFADEFRLRYKSHLAEGRIVNWMSATEKGVRYFYPLIEFQTSSGQTITYRAEERSEGKPLFEQGTKVNVRYLADNPKMVRTVYPK